MTDGNTYAINKHLDEREYCDEPKADSWENREIELDGVTYVLKLKGEAYAAEMEARLAEAQDRIESLEAKLAVVVNWIDLAVGSIEGARQWLTMN